MRYLISAVLLLVGGGSSAFASGYEKRASEQEILATAKQLSSKDCTPPRDSSGLPIAGCRYSATFARGQWSVLVSTLYVGQDGTAGFTPGGDFLYLFQADGKFLERSRGM